MLTVHLQVCVLVKISLLYLNRLWAEVILKPTLRQRFSLFATEFTGRRFYSIFEALSLSLNEVITRQILSTKNYQQAFYELLLSEANVTEAN